MRLEAEIFYEGAKFAIQPLMEAWLMIESELQNSIPQKRDPQMEKLFQTLQKVTGEALERAEAEASRLYPEILIEPEKKPDLISARGGFAPGSEPNG